MKISTKYNTGDKVWYYISELNKYAWGKIISLEVAVRVGRVDCIKYNIENRFYDKDYYSYHRYGYRSYKSDSYLSLLESELFENPEDLIDQLNQNHEDKMDKLVELKKGLFH